jgi:hypothetical protein
MWLIKMASQLSLGFDGAFPEATGRTSHHPPRLLKLDIYSYLNRVTDLDG